MPRHLQFLAVLAVTQPPGPAPVGGLFSAEQRGSSPPVRPALAA